MRLGVLIADALATVAEKILELIPDDLFDVEFDALDDETNIDEGNRP